MSGRGQRRNRKGQWVAGTPRPRPATDEPETDVVIVVGDHPYSFDIDSTPIGFELAQAHERKADA